MVIRADHDAAAHRASTTWSSLQGETMISLPPGTPIQKMVDKHLHKAGVVCRNAAVVNLLDTPPDRGLIRRILIPSMVAL